MLAIIEKAGILDTIQDAGRFQLAHLGIGSSWPMDWYAMRLANALVGNQAQDAVLEMHFPAASIRFLQPAILSIVGADFCASVNHQPVDINRTLLVTANSVLQFENRRNGNCTYLAVRGGWQVPTVLGSKSTNLHACFGGFEGRKLQRNDCLLYNPVLLLHDTGLATVPLKAKDLTCHERVWLFPGLEWNQLTEEAKAQLTTYPFEVHTASNRMAIRLSGGLRKAVAVDPMISAPVVAGTVQMLPTGDLLVLMADHQTVGGYPRIGQVALASLPTLAQCVPGKKIQMSILTNMDLAIEKFRQMKRQIFNASFLTNLHLHDRFD